MSRKPHDPTDELKAKVSALKSFGVPEEEIATYIGISDMTLRKYYAEVLDKANIERNLKVAGFLYRAASGQAVDDGASYSDCIRAAMFYAKTRMQWRETNHVSVTDGEGGDLFGGLAAAIREATADSQIDSDESD